MKIGPVDIRIHAIVWAVGCVAILIFILKLWSSNSDVRLEGYYHDTVIAGMNSESPPIQEEGAEACRSLLKVMPGKTNVRLYLGSILLRLKKFTEAEAAFKEAAGSSTATPDDKAYAWVGAGVAHFRATSNDDSAKYTTAAVETESLFQKAVDAQKTNGDALANLAFVKALAQPKSVSDLQKTYDDALNGTPPPSLSSLQQLYTLHGLILFQQGKCNEALAEFERSQAMQPSGLPGLPSPQDNRRLAMLGGMVQRDISVPQRQDLMQRVQRELPAYGKAEVSVINALGIAKGLLKNDPEYSKTYFKQARTNFNDAINKDAKDGRAYVNQAALMEDRINELGKSLSVPVTGFNGETPVSNPWVELAGKTFPPQVDQAAVSEINTLLQEEDQLWENYFSKADIKLEDKITGKLRQLACVRRKFWLLDPTNSNRTALAARCTTLCDDMVKLSPDDPRTYYAQGVNFLERGDERKAYDALNLAKSKGMSSQVLTRLLRELGGKAEVTDIRPWGGLRFGARPLIRATLRGVNINTIQSVTMKLDNKDVQPARAGSQIMFLPKEEELTDGKHVVNVHVSDGTTDIEVPEISFYMNKKPPEWTVTPVGAEPLEVQPVFTIALKDSAGIDLSTLKLVMKKAGGGFTRELVREGRYRVTVPKLNFKTNDAVTAETFKISTGSDVAPGEYMLTIEVQDTAGNQLNATSAAFKVR